MKICVFLFGQIRYPNDTLRNISENLVVPNNAHVYAAVWSKSGIMGKLDRIFPIDFFSADGLYEYSLIPDNDLSKNKLIQKIPEFRSLVEPILPERITIDEAVLRRVFGPSLKRANINDEQEFWPISVASHAVAMNRNMIKMLFSMYDAISGVDLSQYDAFVCIRPDFVFGEPIDVSKHFKPGTMSCIKHPGYKNYGTFSDQFIISDRNGIEFIRDAYVNFKQISQIYYKKMSVEPGDFIYPERLLYQAIEQAEIKTAFIPNAFGGRIFQRRLDLEQVKVFLEELPEAQSSSAKALLKTFASRTLRQDYFDCMHRYRALRREAVNEVISDATFNQFREEFSHCSRLVALFAQNKPEVLRDKAQQFLEEAEKVHPEIALEISLSLARSGLKAEAFSFSFNAAINATNNFDINAKAAEHALDCGHAEVAYLLIDRCHQLRPNNAHIRVLDDHLTHLFSSIRLDHPD